MNTGPFPAHNFFFAQPPYQYSSAGHVTDSCWHAIVLKILRVTHLDVSVFPMPKTRNDNKEQDEKKLLAEIVKNSKENIETIAKNCGFSRQKAWRMIKELEQRKTIWGYTAIVDYEKQGLQKFMLFFKRLHTPHNTQDAMEIATTHMNPIKKALDITVLSSYRIHGEYDWVTVFTAKDILQAKKFCEALMNRFPDTQTTQLSQILFTVREQQIQNPNIHEMIEHL